MAGRRPGGVTFVAVLIWIQALLYLVAGVLSVLALWIPAIIIDLGWGFGPLWDGVVAIVFAIILFALSSGVLRGNPLARTLITIAFVIGIAGAIISIVHGNVLVGVIGLVLAIFGILLLWAGRAAAFFRA